LESPLPLTGAAELSRIHSIHDAILRRKVAVTAEQLISTGTCGPLLILCSPPKNPLNPALEGPFLESLAKSPVKSGVRSTPATPGRNSFTSSHVTAWRRDSVGILVHP
jgi:hypothetical protein